MIKTLLSLFIGLVSIGLYGQSLAIVPAKSDNHIYGNAYTEHDMESHITIENIGTVPIDVLVKRIDKNYNSLTDSNAICWQICFSTDVSVAPPSTIITLQPGEQTAAADFVGHVYPDQDGNPYAGDITYVFFDANNPTDTVAHTITYEVTTTFDVKEIDPAKLVDVYPNPAHNQITISYNLQGMSNGHFELFNVVGNRVFTKELKNDNGEVKLDISKLKRGVYFYSLRADGESLLTRKLLVE